MWATYSRTERIEKVLVLAKFNKIIVFFLQQKSMRNYKRKNEKRQNTQRGYDTSGEYRYKRKSFSKANCP